MNLEERLNNAKMKLGKLEESRSQSLENYRQEIVTRTAQNEPLQTVQAFTDWVNRYEIESGRQIETLKEEITDLERQVMSEDYQLQKKGRVDLAATKEAARAAWLKNGGDEEGFNQAWPELEKDILKKKTLAVLEDQ